jgi:hypothetical protein
VSPQHSIPGPPDPLGHGRPDFTGYGGPEPRRPGIGVDLRNFIILLMIGAVIFGAVRQCHRTSPEQKLQSPSQETPSQEKPSQEKPSQGKPSQEKLSQGKPSQEKPSSAETPHAQRMASCRTAAERMDKNGALPRDYSINCPYWQWWTHNPGPSRPQPSPDPPEVLGEPEPPRPQVFADPDPRRREKDTLRTWRDRRDRDRCCCQF